MLVRYRNIIVRLEGANIRERAASRPCSTGKRKGARSCSKPSDPYPISIIIVVSVTGAVVVVAAATVAAVAAVVVVLGACR